MTKLGTSFCDTLKSITNGTTLLPVDLDNKSRRTYANELNRALSTIKLFDDETVTMISNYTFVGDQRIVDNIDKITLNGKLKNLYELTNLNDLILNDKDISSQRMVGVANLLKYVSGLNEALIQGQSCVDRVVLLIKHAASLRQAMLQRDGASYSNVVKNLEAVNGCMLVDASGATFVYDNENHTKGFVLSKGEYLRIHEMSKQEQEDNDSLKKETE